MPRFKKKTNIFNVAATGVSAMLSVGFMLYAVTHFGLSDTWPELVLNVFYMACIVMMWMYFFNRMKTDHFNYWSTVCVAVTILLRDILFAPPLVSFAFHLTCLTLSVYLLMMLTYFYARKEWKTYSKGNLWFIFIVDVVIALLYNYDTFLEATEKEAAYLMTEVWIRPTITYGLVACFVKESEEP